MRRAIYEDDVIKLLDKGWKTGVYPAASNIHALPPAQPNVPDTNVGDTISRQAAKLKVARVMWKDGDSYDDFQDKCVDCLDDVPSAQPVLTCKGCKYDYYEYAGCRNCLRRERDLYEPE